MSPIDRISINRTEPNYPLEEERKRQLARRLQLESRETKRLVLPSIEKQSRLVAKQALDDRRQLRELAGRGAFAEQEADSADTVEADLAALAIDVSGRDAAASSRDQANSLTPRFSERKTVAGENVYAQSVIDRKAAAISTAQSKALQETDAAEVAETAHELAAEPAGAGASAGSSWLQKLDAAVADAMGGRSADAAYPFEAVLDQLLNELQARAADSEPLTPDLQAALDALGSERIASFIADPASADHSRLQGSYRFLDAFVQTMESTGAAESQAAAMSDRTNVLADPSDEPQTALGSANDAYEVRDTHSKSDQEIITPARDRQTLYEFLELLSSVAVSGAPLAMQQLAQARKTDPKNALLRLAASGDQAVMLFTPEISRRFDLISARIERDGKKSARANMLADAVATQRQWMQSMLDEANSIVSFNELRRRSEREQRDRNLGETSPQVVLQKT